jgi:hypothetical protein
MTGNEILLWLILSAGFMVGVITMNYWLENLDNKRRERKQLLKRLEDI